MNNFMKCCIGIGLMFFITDVGVGIKCMLLKKART